MQVFKRVLEKLLTPNNESLKLSLDDCHVRGIFSLVVDGVEFGKLTRVFVVENEVKPFDVQLHTHRYPVKLSILKGELTHHVATKNELSTISISEFIYKNFLNEDAGLDYVGETKIDCFDYKLPIGCSVELDSSDFHTISCSKSSIWIVEELGYQSEQSRVLGVPFKLDGLYSKPNIDQIEVKRQLVISELQKILGFYQLANKASK